MFTGIIEGRGKVYSIKRSGDTYRLEIAPEFRCGDTKIGDSISVNGCCLTVVSISSGRLSFDLSAESLKVTTFSRLKKGAVVNLERALPASGRFDGHIVLGHVDGIGRITGIKNSGKSRIIKIKIPSNLSRYIVDKGSIAVDGVSLTVNNVGRNGFEVMIIPHTWKVTAFEKVTPGFDVNLEVDIIGKYVEKFTSNGLNKGSKPSKITDAFLFENGFE